VTRGLRRALIALGGAGFVAGALPLALGLGAEGGHQRYLLVVFGPLTGWAFIGTGIYAWLRRPENGVGALMTAVGFSECLAALRVSVEPWVFIVGLLFIALQWAVLYHLLLAFPGGALQSRLERVLVAVTYASAAIAHPVQVLFQDTTLQGLPANPLLVASEPGLVKTLSDSRFWLGLALLAALVVILARRWHAARGPQRHALAPVLLSGGLVMALLELWYAAALAGLDQGLVDGLEDARIVILATVPFAFLAGLLRSRFTRAGAVSELVARLGDPGERRRGLRDALADALGDPDLTLAYWLPERGMFVSPAGQPCELPGRGSGRVATVVEAAGEPVAAIVHDAALDDERDLVRAVGGAATLALENERLDAQLRAKVEELRDSRERVVRAAVKERRRLERDLHDGAQQRLVSLALSLRQARAKLDEEPRQAAALLESAKSQLDAALEELRELARGIHPAVLSDRGLDAALEALVSRTPLPVELEGTPGGRLPEQVELAAYFVVAEALTNVAKYASATHVSVRAVRDDGNVIVEVADDGVGGADPGRGSGLRGLVDRLSALDGRLEIEGARGGGTLVRADIPLR
jgi:signal transduction histidine kinase